MKIEFEHRHVAPGSLQVTFGSRRLPELLARQLASRIRLTRWLVVLVGAGVIAFATQRAGVALGGALCFFLGALPPLWAAGSLAGALLHMRGAARRLASRHGTRAALRQVEPASRRERVRFELLDSGLQVTRPGRGPMLVGFRRVCMRRLGPEALVVNVAGEAFQVPVEAFSTAGEFDAFCLALQGRLWSAERERS